MSEIRVALSTIETCGTQISVCVAKQSIGVFCKKSSEEERFVDKMSKVCVDMMTTVCIDKKKRSVLVGEGNKVLVDYVVDDKSYDSNVYKFFEIFERCRIMLFEYQMFGLNKDVLFVVKGLWVEDKWYKIEVYPSASIKVIEKGND